MKRLLVLFLCLVWAVPTFADVAKNDSGTPYATITGGSTSFDVTTFTVSAGSNLCLIGVISLGNHSVTNMTMTWNGVSMTGVTAQTGTNSYAQIFALPNPATGNQTLHAAWTTAAGGILAAIAFSGADQSTCIQAADTRGATDTNGFPEVNVPSSSTGATVAVAGHDNGSTAVFSGTGTEFAAETTDEFWSAYAIGGTANDMYWTIGAGGNVTDAWAAKGVHIIAAGTATGPHKGSTSLMGVGR